MRKVILSVAAVLLGITFVCAESCKDSPVKVEYKADEANCGYQTRTCCEDGEWSDWDKDCVSCDCKEGATSQMLCSDYYGEPAYKGRVDVKCNKCKWTAIGFGNCYTPVFVKFVYNFSAPQFYGYEGTFGCPFALDSPFMLYDDETGGLVVRADLNRNDLRSDGNGGKIGSLSTEVIELKSDNDYHTKGGVYDCLNKIGSPQVKIVCNNENANYGGIFNSNSLGGNAGNPIIEEYSCDVAL